MRIEVGFEDLEFCWQHRERNFAERVSQDGHALRREGRQQGTNIDPGWSSSPDAQT